MQINNLEYGGLISINYLGILFGKCSPSRLLLIIHNSSFISFESDRHPSFSNLKIYRLNDFTTCAEEHFREEDYSSISDALNCMSPGFDCIRVVLCEPSLQILPRFLPCEIYDSSTGVDRHIWLCSIQIVLALLDLDDSFHFLHTGVHLSRFCNRKWL